MHKSENSSFGMMRINRDPSLLGHTKNFSASAGHSFRSDRKDRIRKVLIVGALSILLLNIFVIQMGSALSLTVTVGGAYSNVNGGGTAPSCYKTATTWNGVSGTYASYGWPPTSGQCGSQNCPTTLNLNTQSGFGFVPATVGTISDGVIFKLGTFTHYNHPVCSSAAFNTILLTITLNIPGVTPNPTSYAYTMNLDETSNSGVCGSTCAYSPCTTPCPDKVFWSNLGSTTTFTASDGKVYTLEILGFADCTNPGTPISQFITQENINNVACIYGKITECIVTITGNPSPQSVCPGGTALFTATATGPALTYQWYKVGSPDQQLTNTGKYSGVTTATMTITGATSTEAGSYYVKISGSCGTTKTSTSALLTLSTLPSITTQPSSQTVCADSAATFNVVATGSGTLTYQWQRSTNGGTTWSDIAGETGNSLTLSGVTASMSSYQYRVVVTSINCGSVTSNAAILTVQANSTASAGPAQAICAGSTVQLAGSASNYGTVTWSGGAGTFTPNANTLNAVYAPTSTEISGGSVTLKLTATSKSPCANPATSNVVITINTNPIASAGPAQTICAGSTVQLAGSASNYGIVIWSGGAGTFTPNANTLNAVYAPTSTEISGGSVTLKLTATPKSPCATPATSNVVITINTKPSCDITAPSIVCEGTEGFQASVPALTGATYAWTVSGDGQAVSGANTRTLTWKANARSTGTVRLAVTVTGPAPTSCSCTNSVNVLNQGKPTALAGSYGPICSTDTVSLSGTATNYASVFWAIKSGGGSLIPGSEPRYATFYPAYDPSKVLSQTVLTFTATAMSPCTGSVSSDVTITVYMMPYITILITY